MEAALSLLQGTVFSFSMKICGQRQDAEDTMQEVLLKSVPNLPKFDNPKALVVWLYKVAKNRCLMSRRRSKFAAKQDLSLEELMPDLRELHASSGGGSSGGGTPETARLRRESARRLREAVQKLPSEHRLIFVLHDMEELNDKEISEITGLRLGTIRVRLHRARLFVRKKLAKREQKRLQDHAPNARPGSHISAQRLAGNAHGEPRQRHCKEMFAELSDYLDEELDDSLCEELEKHLTGCELCRAFLSSLEYSIEQCRTAPSESPDSAHGDYKKTGTAGVCCCRPFRSLLRH